MVDGFDFATWLALVLPTAALLAQVNVALVQGLGKWVSGQAQTVTALVSGMLIGVAAQWAFFGQPGDVLGWFLLFVFGALVGGVSIGTYEAKKHAAIKARE